jgi:hypothetical protein
MYITEGLIFHFMVMSILVVIIALTLHRKHLLHWRSAGFWALSAIMLYFVITPGIQELGGDRYYLETRLAMTEGLPRMLWVTLCVAVGIAVFYLAYFNTKPGRPNFGLPLQTWPHGAWIIVLLCLLAAGYSLAAYRGIMDAGETQQITIVAGKFTGETTGYVTVMHIFASVPIILLIFRRSTRLLGIAILGMYLGARLQDIYDRTSAVSLMLAISIMDTYRKNRKWPSIWWLGVVLIFTLVVQARGHQSMTRFVERGQERQALEITQEEVRRGEGASMLATLYLKTYVQDKAGYSYGVPIISGVLFGALPRKYFPWKDWMVEEYAYGDISNVYGSELMSGAKHTVIGDLYGSGGIIAIFLGMPLLGFLTRKLDGFLSPQSPLVVRALGSTWLGTYWMMFGSALTWSFAGLYLSAVPFLAILFMNMVLTPKDVREKNKQASLKAPGALLIRH